MKTFKKLLALLGATTAIALCFTACGENADQSTPIDHTHTFSEEWTNDGSDHWHAATCGHKNEQSEKAAHTFTEKTEGTADCTHGVTVTKSCSVCGYTVVSQTSALGHTWKEFERVEPTCENDGHTAYRQCETCGVKDGYKILMKTGKHFFDETKWEYDQDKHWHPSVCGCNRRSGEAAHVFDDDTGTCVCGYVYPNAEQDRQSEAFYVFAENGGAYSVSGLTEAGKAELTLSVPAQYKGKSVTGIGTGAFIGSKATKVVLPETVVTVGDFAFQNCESLAEIVLPEKLSSLGEFDYQVFSGCKSLKTVALPASVTSIGQNMFKNCSSLTAVTFGGDVTLVDTQAFYGCTKLEALNLPSKLSFIGQKAFAESGLKSLSVEMTDGGRIAEGAFTNCKSLTTLSVTGGSEYFASPVLAGCEKLGTLTVPFVGSHKQAARATDLHFGYLFGKGETASGYAIPATLKTVNVKGGSVELGAFANCGDLAVNAEPSVDVKTKTFEGYTGEFTWEGELPGPTVNASVNPETVYVNDSAELKYEVGPNYGAPNDTTVAITVTKDGGEAVLNTDYSVEGNTYTFNTIGVYAITVTATYNGISASKQVTVTVADRAAAPEIEVSAASAVITEGDDGAALTVNVTYAKGDGEKENGLTYSVFVQEKGSENYVNADATWYEFVKETKTFKAKVAGNYRVTVSVMSEKGGIASKDVDITVNAVDLAGKLALGGSVEKTNGWVRLATGNASELAYTVEGQLYVGGYNVVYSATNGATATAGTGSAVSVSLAEPNTSVVSVSYVHKNEALEKSFTLEIPVSFVTDVETAPVLGSDPFGGTYDKLLPGTGMMLYYDVAESAEGEQLAYSEIVYSVVSYETSTDKPVSVGKVNGQDEYPFVLVEDFDAGNHTTTGVVTVKLTATKNGQTVAATKTFTIETLPDPASNNGLNAYLDAAYPGTRGPLNMDVIMENGHRDNVVLSKEGLYIHRSAGDWNPAGNMFCVTPEGDGPFADNFRLDFDYMIVKRTQDNKKASFAINYRTGAWGGYCGSQTAFYVETDQTEITCGYWGDGQDWEDDRILPAATVGQILHIRLTHTVRDGKAEYLWQWSLDGEDYEQHKWFRISVDVSQENANMGSPIYAMQFNYEQGSFYLGNFKLTDLGD